MAGKPTVAWAVLVNAVTLGASIEAHALTKSTESKFQRFIDTMPAESAVQQLPGEIVATIITHARQMHFNDLASKWEDAWWCFRGRCNVSEHLSEEECKSLKKRFLRAAKIKEVKNGEYWAGAERTFDAVVDDLFDDELRDEGVGLDSDEHVDNIKFLELKMNEEHGTLNDDVEYQRAKKLFTEDFGLEVHFQTDDSEHDPRGSQPNGAVESYLLLPTDHAIMRATAAGRLAPLDTDMNIDPAIRKEPTEAQKQIFNNAIRVLGVKRVNTGSWLKNNWHFELVSLEGGNRAL